MSSGIGSLPRDLISWSLHYQAFTGLEFDRPLFKYVTSWRHTTAQGHQAPGDVNNREEEHTLLSAVPSGP